MEYHYTLLAVFAITSMVNAGVIPTTFNLISAPQIIPQETFTFGQLHNVVHSTIPIQVQPAQSLAHPAVVENAIAESQLPSHLRNNFYKDPNVAASLARESWFGDKEFPVQHRDAEDIPRSEIAKIVDRIEHRA